MIGKVAGRLEYRATDHVLIDTGGVGYLVFCSERTLAALPAAGETVALFTEMLVREDLIQLYGFLSLAEREWHRLLMSVQGVGAKAALSVLGALGAEGVARAVSLGDLAAIRAAPGIGPKIAQRIVLELKSRAPVVMAMGAAGARPAVARGRSASVAALDAPMAPPAAELNAGAQAEALSALLNLGYGAGEAASAVAEVAAADAGLGTPDLIRAALRRLAPKA